MPYNEVGNGSFVWNGDNANAYVKTNAFQVNFVHEKGYKKSEQAWTMFAKSHKMAIIGFDISKDCNINIHHDGGFVNPDYNLHGYLYYLVERNGVIMLAAQKETNQMTVEENAFAHSFNVLKGDKVYIAFTSKNEYSCAYNIELKFDFSDPVAGKDLERNVNGLSLNDIVSQGKGYSVATSYATLDLTDYNNGNLRYLLNHFNNTFTKHDNVDGGGLVGDDEWSAGYGDYVSYDIGSSEMYVGPNRGMLIRAIMNKDGALTIGNRAFTHGGHGDAKIKVWVEKNNLISVKLDKSFNELKAQNGDSNTFAENSLAIDLGNLNRGDVVNVLYITNPWENNTKYNSVFNFENTEESFTETLTAQTMLSSNQMNNNNGGISYYADYQFKYGTIKNNTAFPVYGSQKVSNSSSDTSTWAGEWYINPWEKRVEGLSKDVIIKFDVNYDSSLKINLGAITKKSKDYKDLRIDVVVKRDGKYITYSSKYLSILNDMPENSMVPGKFNVYSGDEVYFVFKAAQSTNGAIPVPTFEFGPKMEVDTARVIDGNIIVLDTKLNEGKETGFDYGSYQFLTGTLNNPIEFDVFDTPTAWQESWNPMYDSMYLSQFKDSQSVEQAGPYVFGQQFYSNTGDYQFIYKVEITKAAYLNITHPAFPASLRSQ